MRRRPPSLNATLAGRSGVDRQRVDAGGKIVGQCLIDHAMAVDPGLSFEGLRHNINSEMRLPARPSPGMALVLMGFVHHVEALRLESLGQLPGEQIDCSHAVEVGNGIERVNGLISRPNTARIVLSYRCQVLKPSAKEAHKKRS